MMYDVLTGIVHGGELYVLIIIIHGMLMLHVAHIYACNMKENALASCISYARVHRVESGVGAWYCLFTGVGKWVVSLDNGIKSKVETHEGVKPFKWQVMCVGRIWV